MENDNAVNNSTDVSSLMNEYYVNITKTIGYDDSISQDDTFDDIVSTHVNNCSVLYIKDDIATSTFVSKLLNLHMCLTFRFRKGYSCQSVLLKIVSLT